MNILRKIYCRGYQGALRVLLPVLPYREPDKLEDYDQLVEVLQGYQISSVLVVTDKGIRDLGLTEKLEEALSEAGIEVAVYDGTAANPTTANVDASTKLYREHNCQAIIAFGGGSAMDCGKATGIRIARPNKPLGKMEGILKVRRKIPLLIAIPTTAGTGSEATLAAVITDSETRHKYAINDFALIPRYALFDPSLTLGLPPAVTAATGMDALTHAMEAYLGRSTTRETRGQALEAAELIIHNLEEAYKNGDNLAARGRMLRASYLAGLAFTQSYVGYVHALAHALGGKYDVPHGRANAVLLPYVLKAYRPVIDKKLRRMALATGVAGRGASTKVAVDVMVAKVEELNRKMGLEDKIPEIREEDIPELARTAAREANPLYPVPVLWDEKKLAEILREVAE